MIRKLIQVGLVAAVVAGAAVGASSAVAGTNPVAIAGKSVAIKPSSKAFSIGVTCHNGSDACQGTLYLETAKKVKPYSSLPAQIFPVGTFPFTIAAGQTRVVKGRVYGGALAEAMNHGRVRLMATAHFGSAAPVATRVVLFTLKRR
ncbi:MAG TPA: hypothetical protein VNH40_12825 [Gaiellaceae bacterium]|nr:hypothetical protein [Gaiellaceae bacterium]